MTETTEYPEDWSEEWIEIHKLGREQGMKTIQNVTSLQNKLIADLSGQIKNLRSEVTSLTKERDELAFSLKHRDKLIKHLKSQLSNRDEEIEPVIKCLKEILFKTLDTDSIGIDNEFIQDVGLKHGCLTQRCPTEEELGDPEWFGHEYEIKEGQCAVIEINLPDLLQSKEGEEK